MPIYEFRCARCGRRFEVIQRSREEKKPPCPECGSRRVSRLISPAGFVLRGSGWYKTDYPSEARRKAMEAEKGGGEHAGEKKEAKAEAGVKGEDHKAHHEKKKEKKKAREE